MADITYETIKSIDGVRGIPLLTLDERWYKLITDKNKTDEIKYWENQVNDLIKKQGQINNDIKEVKKLKSRLIQDVVDNMEGDANSSAHKKKMENNQRLIQEANDKLTNLEDDKLELPAQLVTANVNLLAETLKVLYGKMNTNKEDLEILDKWINATRIKLKKNLLVKADKEEYNSKVYTYIHDMLGPDILAKIDQINEGN